MLDHMSYTTEEIAKLLKVSKLTVYDLIKKGQLSAYRVGRQMRIDRTELENYKLREKEVILDENSVKERNVGTPIRQIIISGQDNSLDILARQLEMETDLLRPLRSHMGSLDSLIQMYLGEADIVSTHLLDGDTMEYNISYIRKLLVSKKFKVIHFIKRQAGLYVAKGNPKQITSWGDFKRQDIEIINREPGAGARVLLDEQLRINQIDREKVNGYQNEQTSHLAIASMIAKGTVDVGIGIERIARMAKIDFVPLIKESYDLVILNTEENQVLIAHIDKILSDPVFRGELESLGYDIAQMGTVLYKQ